MVLPWLQGHRHETTLALCMLNLALCKSHLSKVDAGSLQLLAATFVVNFSIAASSESKHYAAHWNCGGMANSVQTAGSNYGHSWLDNIPQLKHLV